MGLDQPHLASSLLKEIPLHSVYEIRLPIEPTLWATMETEVSLGPNKSKETQILQTSSHEAPS